MFFVNLKFGANCVNISFMITAKELDKLANLARIFVPDLEKENLRGDIENILAYIDVIKNVLVKNAKNWEPEGSNVFREDENARPGGEFSGILVQAAPRKEDGYVKVKKILG